MFGVNGDLPGLRAEHRPGDADDIPNVKLLEGGVFVHAQIVPGNVSLDRSGKILNVTERRLAHYTLGKQATCQRNVFPLPFVKAILYVFGVMGNVKFRNAKRILPRCLQFGKLFPADGALLTDIDLICMFHGFPQERIVIREFQELPFSERRRACPLPPLRRVWR